MSNSIAHSLLNRSILNSSHVPSSSLCQLAGSVKPAALRKIGKPRICTEFYGKSLNNQGRRLTTETVRPVSVVPKAALDMDPASSEPAKRFNLEGNIELEVDVSPATKRQVNIEIGHCSKSLLLHWGAIRDRKDKWVIPSLWPAGTKNYRNRALRTPFLKFDSTCSIKLVIEDPSIQAIEFLIFDEAKNKWYKNNGKNFHIKLPKERNLGRDIYVPEDLVQIQEYLRWERRRRQDKEEYEAARTELVEEITKGASVEHLRAKLKKSEFQEAREELPLQNSYFIDERFRRKEGDLNQIPPKPFPKLGEPKQPIEQALSTIEQYAKAKVKEEFSPILMKKIFKTGGNEHLVLISKPAHKMKIQIATDLKEPVTLHWALSKKRGEWLVLPLADLPNQASGVVETNPAIASAVPNKVQTFKLEIDGDNYKGMRFAFHTGEKWIKNMDSVFYLDLEEAKQVQKDVGYGKGIAKYLLDRIAEMENKGLKSFMHRFDDAAKLMDEAKGASELGFAGMLVWMRLMATKQLVWNYVNPRKISEAQDRLTNLLQDIYASNSEHRELLRMIMSTVGRGGEGDIGQRIHDGILVIQRNNNCKGGMMEEWKQKLHNNSSPDDVIICQALIDYIKSDFHISVYWNTLNKNGINEDRLLSYKCAIHSEPSFTKDQKDGLLRDLEDYMKTLKDAHSGAYLKSAISNCIDHTYEGQDSMFRVQKDPIPGLPSGLLESLRSVREKINDRTVEALLEDLLKARRELQQLLSKSHERLKDLLFLDLALDYAVRNAVERGYEELNNAGTEKIMKFIRLVAENLALSSNDNKDLVYFSKEWDLAMNMLENKKEHWALYAKSVLDRTQLALSSKAEWYFQVLQPSADYLGSHLEVDHWTVNTFAEDMIRTGSAATLSSLLNRLDLVLRKKANLGSWQVTSAEEVVGYVTVVDELRRVQYKYFDRPVIIVANGVTGEEEIPDRVVAVLTLDMPDVLSHVSVNARMGKICFATCLDNGIFSDLRKKNTKLLRLNPTSADVVYREASEGELSRSSSAFLEEIVIPPNKRLDKKKISDKYAISYEDFTNEVVGAKSTNIKQLKGIVETPKTVALPFGVFDKVLSQEENKAVAAELQELKEKLKEGKHEVLRDIRNTVLKMAPTKELEEELKNKMQSSGMQWLGEGDQRWNQAWTAIKKMWALKWNKKVYDSMKNINHDDLSMAVMVQEIIDADYAFRIPTTKPSASEIYAEVVMGIGKTLDRAYPGRALSFICNKNNLNSPQVLSFPSKPVGLLIKPSTIFQSDPNVEGFEDYYEGADLYDSVQMDEEAEVVLDYSASRLITDENFRQKILSAIASAGKKVEDLYKTPQEIEGVIKGEKLYVVRTRPRK